MAEDFQGFGVCGEAWWPYDLASRTFFGAGDVRAFSGCQNNRNDDVVRTVTTSGDSGGSSSFVPQPQSTAAAARNPSDACWTLIGSPPINDDWNSDFLNLDSRRSEEIYSDMMQETDCRLHSTEITGWSQMDHPSHVSSLETNPADGFAAHSCLLQAAFSDEFHPVQTLSPSPNQQMNPTDQSYFWKSMVDANFLPSSLTAKKYREECDEFASEVKRIMNERIIKRTRLETPSPLPTFKVRKEKLGDRITALQQLVSPFGKTDTASVLHEAIEYIKFLHEQVSVFSSSNVKDGLDPLQLKKVADSKTKDQEGPMHDLKSRGLCLMPVSSIFPVASEASGDYFCTPAAFSSFIR